MGNKAMMRSLHGNKYQSACEMLLTLVTVVYIKRVKRKHWWRCGEEGTLILDFWECRLIQSMEKSMEIKKKCLTRTTIWSDNSGYPSSRCLSKEPIQKIMCTVMFLTIDKILKVPNAQGQIRDTEYVVCIHNGILLSH